MEEKAIERFEQEAKTIYQPTITIRTREDFDQSMQKMEIVKQQQKKVTEWKNERIKPINDALKKIRADIKPIEDILSATERSIKDAQYKYYTIQKAKEEEKKREIAAQVEQGKVSFEKATQKMEKVESKAPELKTRKIQEVEISDPSKVPASYWIIDEVRLRHDALEAAKNNQTIPGTKVVTREIVIK